MSNQDMRGQLQHPAEDFNPSGYTLGGDDAYAIIIPPPPEWVTRKANYVSESADPCDIWREAYAQGYAHARDEQTIRVRMKRFDEALSDSAEAYGVGAFSWWWYGEDNRRTIHFRYPGGRSLIIVSGPEDLYEADHTWDGNYDRPTVSPEILVADPYNRPLWRGHIRDGYLESIE